MLGRLLVCVVALGTPAAASAAGGDGGIIYLHCETAPSKSNPPPDGAPMPVSIKIDRTRRAVLDLGNGVTNPSVVTDGFTDTTISAHQALAASIFIVTIDRLTGKIAVMEQFPKSAALWQWDGTCAAAKPAF
jgi:hypothetical protein